MTAGMPQPTPRPPTTSHRLTPEYGRAHQGPAGTVVAAVMATTVAW